VDAFGGATRAAPLRRAEGTKRLSPYTTGKGGGLNCRRTVAPQGKPVKQNSCCQRGGAGK